jgi:hypothetical protein
MDFYKNKKMTGRRKSAFCLRMKSNNTLLILTFGLSPQREHFLYPAVM